MAMMKKLTSAIVASSLVLSLVGAASAATPDQENAAASRMQALGLVQGKGGSDLALGDPITRAELVTIIVRAFGQEANANYLKGVAAFSDTADHWASGYIAMADQLIKARTNGTEVLGYPDGTFRPDQQVTTAEAVAFLMKFTGAPADSTLSWPDNYLQGAVNAGIISAEDLASLESIKNVPADRGLAFYLADSAFSGYKLAEGSTVYRTFVDNVAPELTITTQAPAPTLDSKITITGTVANAESVFVGTPDHAATIVDGTYSIDVDLAMGENNITVTAVDMVGNTTERTLTVTRTTGPATAIEAQDITVTAGATVDVVANVVDAAGNALEGQTITGESTVGTYADGKFTAGTKAGAGTLTLKSGDFTKTVNVTVVPGDLAGVVAESGFAPGKAVKLIGVDAYGNVVDGVSFSEEYDNAYIEGDKFIATTAGSYTITATKGDITVQGVVGAYGDVSDLVIEAPKSVVANGDTVYTVVVKAVDKNGFVVSDFDGYVRYDGDLDIDSEIVAHSTDGDNEPIVEMKNGVATIDFKAPTSVEDLEEAELDFTLYEELDDAKTDEDDVADGDVTLDVEEQVATTFSVEADKYLPVNMDIPAEVTVYVYDQAGVEMESGAWDFKIKIKGPAELSDLTDDDEPTLENGESIYLEAADEDETGDVVVTITATDEELEGQEAHVTIQAVEAGSPKGVMLTADDDKVEAGDENTYTVKFVDKNGVPTEWDDDDDAEVTVTFEGVTEDLNNVIQSVVDADGHSVSYTVDGNSISFNLTNGDYEAVITTVNKKAGNFTITAEAEDLEKSASVASVVVADEDAPHYVGFKSGKVYVAKGDEVTLVAQLYDKYGNPLAKSGIPIKFATTTDYKSIELNGDDDEVTVETDANGQAVVTADLDRKAPGYTITATPDTDVVEDTLPEAGLDFAQNVRMRVELAVSSVIPASMDVEIVDAAGHRISKAGIDDEAYLKLTFKDDEGDKIKGASDGAAGTTDFPDLTDYIKVDADQRDADVDSFTWSNAREGWTAKLDLTKLDLGKVNYTVEYLGVEESLTKARALTLEAGSVANVAVEDADENSGVWVVEAKPKKSTEITLQLVDEGDNLVSRSKVDTNYVIVIKPAEGASITFLNDDEALDTYTLSGSGYEGVQIKKGRNSVTLEVIPSADNQEFTLELYEQASDGSLITPAVSSRNFKLSK